MKVLQINSFFSVGGPPRIVNGIYDTLMAAGHECKIAAAREVMYAPEASIRIGSRSNVYLNAIKARFLDNEGLSSKKSTRNLIKEIDKYDPDIIQLHNLHGYYLNYEILFDYLKKSGKPVVWTLHDCWAMTGHCTHFDYIGCEKWKNMGCSKCPQIREYPMCIGIDSSNHNYKSKKKAFCDMPEMTLVTVSYWLKSVVEKSFLSEYPVVVIPNGIDLEVFKPTNYDNLVKKYGLEGKKIILGVAQNWGMKKGLNDMISLSEHLGVGYQVILVGLTTQQQKHLPPNVIGITRTNSIEDLASVYSLAHIFINPSVEETMGMTTVEALACGTPAIVYNKTAVPEVVDSSCGWVVKPHDLKKMIEIIESVESKDKYYNACLRRAKLYEKKQQYSMYVALYEHLVEESRGMKL